MRSLCPRQYASLYNNLSFYSFKLTEAQDCKSVSQFVNKWLWTTWWSAVVLFKCGASIQFVFLPKLCRSFTASQKLRRLKKIMRTQSVYESSFSSSYFLQWTLIYQSYSQHHTQSSCAQNKHQQPTGASHIKKNTISTCFTWLTPLTGHESWVTPSNSGCCTVVWTAVTLLPRFIGLSHSSSVTRTQTKRWT